MRLGGKRKQRILGLDGVRLQGQRKIHQLLRAEDGADLPRLVEQRKPAALSVENHHFSRLGEHKVIDQPVRENRQRLHCRLLVRADE
jgi:hypothetical protein